MSRHSTYSLGKFHRYQRILLGVLTPALLLHAQEEPVTLTIDVENTVLYRGNVSDVTRFGKDPGPISATEQIPFVNGINVGDIVAINGKPAKGVWSSSYTHTTAYRAAPQAGQFAADVDTGATLLCTWQIYAPDGTFLGMIRDSGAAQGHTVTGALAGLLGVTGAHFMGAPTVPSRVATFAEDPANRRILGGGKFRTTFYLYPKVRPSVKVAPNGTSIFHSDFSPVTAANPARPGETLILGALGLGPVKPNLEPPGVAAFSSSPVQEVNAPVSILFNGIELPVSSKVGWPGEKHLYRIEFQVPSDATPGTATLQLIATWIPGPATNISVGSR